MTRLTALLAIFACGLALASCKGEEDNNVIKVAIAGPQTGQYASLGTQMTTGGETAIADINASGGVLGKKLKLEIGDDACDPKQAVAVANQLTGDNVALVAGHFCSGSSIPASNVYAESNLVMISPASTNPALTDKRAGPNIYRVCGRDDKQGAVAGAYLAEHFGDKNIAIIDDKTAYGRGLADEVKKALNAKGVQEVFRESITAGEKDYSALVSKLKRAGVDALFIGGYHTEAGLILRQMRDQDMDTVLMGGDALVTQEYWSITGSAGEGTLMTFSPDPRQNPAAADVVKRLKAKGVEPEGYVLYTYAAVQAWKEAAEKAGSIDAPAVVKALNENTIHSVIGDFKFDEKGDPSLPPYAVYRWSNGSYEQISKDAEADAAN
ncbi:MAG: branched-chain amino acid ABC transporter substrate-binding protein [Methyloceanibacter sp.]|uniref:branched-chain amino acid ABC transporter substrate-binding protein n=1 Tax=Methyloceanibacter sp. TaxID=1965321 RepID=UPI001D95ED90|nr:branched-chain amino acid ABC transporter substrate-binding protein [Methyloceanibacter sp.]MCB1443650.1 branched-chain amino acid ABC transporter substrate-binding protein [Methyloceanibacter sp.]